MTLIYLDLFTTILFFLFIGYIERKGVFSNPKTTPIQIQKINELLFRNHWLYVLPYFYSITLWSDIENLLAFKSFMIQILYFFLFIIIQFIIFLRLQSLPFLAYIVRLKEHFQKIRLKFFQVPSNKNTVEQNDDLLEKRQNTSIAINEISFLLNSFAFPFLLILTNAYFFTKLLFILFNL